MSVLVQPTVFSKEEEARLQELYNFRVLDRRFGPEFDEIVQAAAAICETPISFISIMDRDRQTVKASIGREFEEMPRRESFCQHAITGRDLFEIADLTQDDRFNGSPLVSEEAMRFYAAVPLRTDSGYNLGALCIIDYKPRELSDLQRKALRLLARQAVTLMDLLRQREALSQHSHFLVSLEFARRMQQATLPNLTAIPGFDESFTLFQPRNTVGGDFYWAFRGNQASVLAVGDCTGTGLPGALVANMADNMLDGMVRPDEIPSPDLLLNRLAHAWALRAGRQDYLQTELMNLGLLVLDKHRKVGSFAAAGAILYLVQDGHCEAIRGDRSPIGADGASEYGFTRILLDLSRPTSLYLTSAGFTEQLSAENKPFGQERLIRLLEEMAPLPAARQRQVALAALNAWRGTADQTADICLVGMRVG